MKRLLLATCLLLPVSFSGCGHDPVTKTNEANVNASKLAADSRRALSQLYAQHPNGRKFGANARGILVFPKITKGGLVVGGQGGNGTLFVDGQVRGFYQSAGVSYGLQAGVQQFGYALFLMDDQALRNLNAADGWEVGSAPSLVVLEEGMSGSLSTTTMRKGTYAVFFNQKGLMAGLGLQGTKITRIRPQG
jgi:lipid-binding SYLF domain-containing protein